MVVLCCLLQPVHSPPEKDRESILKTASEKPRQPSLFDDEAWKRQKGNIPLNQQLSHPFSAFNEVYRTAIISYSLFPTSPVPSFSGYPYYPVSRKTNRHPVLVQIEALLRQNARHCPN